MLYSSLSLASQEHENIPLQNLNWKEEVCSIWNLLGVMRYQGTTVSYDGKRGHIPSLEHAKFVSCLVTYGSEYQEASLIKYLELYDENPACEIDKGQAILQGITEAETISSRKLCARIAVLLLTQSFIGELIFKYFLTPKILKRLGVSLEDEFYEPKPIITVKDIPVINVYDVINYSYNIVQYASWFTFIKTKGSNSDFAYFFKSLVGRLTFDMLFNWFVHSAKLSYYNSCKRSNRPPEKQLVVSHYRHVFYFKELIRGCGFFYLRYQ